MSGELLFDTSTEDTYIFNKGKWECMTDSSTKNLVFAGTFNARTATVESSTKAGKKLGFFEGKRLPPCFPVNHGYYVVVSQGAFYARPPDYLISTPNGWQKCELADVLKPAKIN